MKVIKPMSYNVELTIEEKQAVKKCIEVLETIYKEMNICECDVVLSGYEECPYETPKGSIESIKAQLQDLIANGGPYSIY